MDSIIIALAHSTGSLSGHGGNCPALTGRCAPQASSQVIMMSPVGWAGCKGHVLGGLGHISMKPQCDGLVVVMSYSMPVLLLLIEYSGVIK